MLVIYCDFTSQVSSSSLLPGRQASVAAMQAAAAAEVQTELAARVSSWRQKIQPMLQEQDARPAFDIHQYGDNILDRLAVLSCKDPSHPVELEAHTVRNSATSSQ